MFRLSSIALPRDTQRSWPKVRPSHSRYQAARATEQQSTQVSASTRHGISQHLAGDQQRSSLRLGASIVPSARPQAFAVLVPCLGLLLHEPAKAYLVALKLSRVCVVHQK